MELVEVFLELSEPVGDFIGGLVELFDVHRSVGGLADIAEETGRGHDAHCVEGSG